MVGILIVLAENYHLTHTRHLYLSNLNHQLNPQMNHTMVGAAPQNGFLIIIE